MQQLGVAVVGTSFGARVHVPALRAAGFDVRALVGRDPERTSRRAQRVGVEHACATLTEALAVPGVDAVTNAAPPAEHAGLALDTAEGAEVLRAARQAGIVHALGHELRWFPERVAIGRAISNDMIGEPKIVSLVDFVALLVDPAIRMPAWFYDAKVGGGWLGASGSHAIDMVRLWLGEFEHVSAITSVTDPVRRAGSAPAVRRGLGERAPHRDLGDLGRGRHRIGWRVGRRRRRPA
jgi:predicted dehydrogenase